MSAEAVKVIVRCRPMNERENRLNCEVCCVFSMATGSASCLCMSEAKRGERESGRVCVIETARKRERRRVQVWLRKKMQSVCQCDEKGLYISPGGYDHEQRDRSGSAEETSG